MTQPHCLSFRISAAPARIVLLAGCCILLWATCVSTAEAQTAPSHSQNPPAARAQEPDDPNAPRALLILSHAYARNMRPGDRAYLLTVAFDMTANIDPALCRQWSKELLALADTFPPSSDRVAAQKNALVALSHVDAKEAFALFPKLDIPVPLKDGRLPEDVRADGATTVFGEYWKHHQTPADLQALREQADKLGNTGQYPYLAMQPILLDVMRHDSMEGENLFLELLGYYRRKSIFDREDQDFQNFLNGVWDALSDPLRRQALSAAVNRLLDESAPRDGEIFAGTIKSEKGVVHFSSKAQMLLYQLMPRIKEFDPGWAGKLAEENPFLKDAADQKSGDTSGSMIIHYDPNNTFSTSVATLQAQASQGAIYGSAVSMAATDPDSALLLAPRLDNSYQAALYAEVASVIYPKNAARASSLMSTAAEQIENIHDPAARFSALLAFARSAFKQKDMSRFEKAVEDAFSLGTEQVAEELQVHPQEMVYQTKVFSGLEQLAFLDMSAEDDKALSRIRSIDDEAVRSILLAESAYTENTLRQQKSSHTVQQ
jgi:hypothetical protein